MENRYIMFTFAILASLMVIAVVLVLSQYINNTKVSEVYQSLQQVQVGLQSLQVLSLLGNSKSTSDCSMLSAGIGTLSTQLFQLGSEVQAADMENQSGSQYTNLVNQLSYARIEYWLLAQKARSQCGKVFTTVLMLYSPVHCNGCVLESDELSYIQNKDPNFSFVVLDGEWNLSIVKALDASYNVNSSEYPAIIVNGIDVARGYLSSSQIVSDLCKYTNITDFCNNTI